MFAVFMLVTPGRYLPVDSLRSFLLKIMAKKSAYKMFIEQSDLTEAEESLINLASSIRAKELLEKYIQDVFSNATYIRQGSKSFFSREDMLSIKERIMKK